MSQATTAAPPVMRPAWLDNAEREVWNDLAPHAAKELTLTPSTARAFGDLCRAIVMRDTLLARINADGWTITESAGEGDVRLKRHPLFVDHRSWQQRVEAGQMRFRLTAMGKELITREPEADPFDQFDDPSRVQ